MSQTTNDETGWATESHYESGFDEGQSIDLFIVLFSLRLNIHASLFVFFFITKIVVIYNFRNRCLPRGERNAGEGGRMWEPTLPVHPSAAASFGIDFNKQKSHLVLKRRGRKR